MVNYNDDGFTLVKGISSYGLKKMRMKAGLDDDMTNMSDLTKTNMSHLGA